MTVLCAASGYNPDFIVPSTVTSIHAQAIDGISIRSLVIPSTISFNGTRAIVWYLQRLQNLYLYCDVINNSNLVIDCRQLKNVFYGGKYNATNKFMSKIPNNVNVYVNNPNFKIISGIKTKYLLFKFPNEYFLSCELPYIFSINYFNNFEIFIFLDP